MIEPTDDMLAAWLEAWNAADPAVGRRPKRVKAALAAVLAIVERDYEPRRCDELNCAGHRCTKPRGHNGGHGHRFTGTVWP